MKENKENSYLHILKYTGIFGGVQGLNILVGVLRNKFAALFLGPAGMGLLSLFNSTVNLISSATNFGIPTTGVRIITEGEGKERHCDDAVGLIRTYSLISASLGLIITILLGPLLDDATFSWGNHILHYILLGPIVFFTILSGGELAILKGTHQLKALAFCTSALAIFSLLVSVPIYWFWGIQGILSVLFLIAFGQWIFCFLHTVRLYPLHFDFSRASLWRGLPLLRMGMAFVISGFLNSGAEFLMRAYLNNTSNLELVGLFNAGVTIVIVYAGMVFSVMESDYYPRLSAVSGVGRELNLCVNRQLEVNVLLMGPIIMTIILGLPVVIPLLYDTQFMGMLLMTQIAALSMIFKAVYQPIEYLPLARGESRYFLVQESFAVSLLLVCQFMGFEWGGLSGLGAGIVVAYAIESFVVMLFSRWHYGYLLSEAAWRHFAWQVACGAFMFWLVLCQDYLSVTYWAFGILIVLCSTAYSLIKIRRILR